MATIQTKTGYFVTITETEVTIQKLAKGKMWTKTYTNLTCGELGKKLTVVEQMTDSEWAWFCGWTPENLEAEDDCA